MKKRNLFILPLGLLLVAGCQEGETQEETRSKNQPDKAQQEMPQQGQGQQQTPQMQQNPQMQQPGTQIEISEKELEKFVDIDMEMRKVQQKAQQKMIAVIQEKGMEVEKFQEISKSQQQGGGTAGDFSENELQKFNDINQNLAEIDQELQKEVKGKIKEEGVTVERYQEIAMAVRQDPGLQQKLQQIFQEKAGGQQNPQMR